MMNTKRRVMPVLSVLMLGGLLMTPTHLRAHCDGMDGPVVAAAERALETGDVRHALVWVRPGDEDEIRTAFARTVEVRMLGDAARELADLAFFETLVRVHRIGEGASYTGLKPRGLDLGPVIPAADRALVEGDAEALEELLLHHIRHGIREHFEAALAARDFDPVDVPAGQAFAEAYARFLHYVEAIHGVGAHGGH
jgi:hypothetical protein